jgi:hypothetical protein
VKLSAGRYRVYFIGDAPGTVSVPVTGSASRKIHPTEPTAASAQVQRLPVQQMTHVEGRQPISLAPRSVSLSTVLIGRSRAYVGTLGACLTTPGGECDGGADGTYTGYAVSPTSEFDYSFTVSYADGAKQAGRHDARQTAENIAGITFGIGASFTLRLR